MILDFSCNLNHSMNSKALLKKCMTKPELLQPLFICSVLSYIKMPPRRVFYTHFGDVQIASNAAKMNYVNKKLCLIRNSGALRRSRASGVTSQAVFSKLLICYACYIVLVACYPRSFRQMLIQSD